MRFHILLGSQVCTSCFRANYTPSIGIRYIWLHAVVDLEIAFFSHWRMKQTWKFWGCHAHFRSHMYATIDWELASELFKIAEVRTEYLKVTLGLVKCLEISKERECVTVPGCCCCMSLLYNHLMDWYSYIRKNILLATKGGCICTP